MASILGGRGDRLRWSIIAAIWLIDFVGLMVAPLDVQWLSFAPSIATAFLFVGVGVLYRTKRPVEPIASTLMVAAQVLLFTLGSALANYLGAAVGRPLYDAQLAAVDRALGFDWHGYVAAIHAWSVFERVLLLAYNTSLAQVAIVILVLGLTGRRAALDRFALAFMVSAIGTVAVWTVFPSFGAFHYFYVTGGPVPQDGIAFTIAYADTLSQIHAGGPQILSFTKVVGLVGFPSFHTALAILCTLAIWRIRILGPLALVLNVLVLLSVPGDGGHHLVDIFGGVAMTVLATVLAAWLLDGGWKRWKLRGTVARGLSDLRT